jgi:uncharacterized membrane protein
VLNRLTTFTIVLVFALIAVVVAWQLAAGISTSRILLCAVLTCPLWAPLRGLARGDRRTYAWATLCVIPYFILGLVEAVANPERRLWPALCLAIALMLFVALIVYLRASNPLRNATTSTSDP